MATYIKAGLYRPPFVKEDEDLEVADVYIDAEIVQILNENHIHIKARANKN